MWNSSDDSDSDTPQNIAGLQKPASGPPQSASNAKPSKPLPSQLTLKAQSASKTQHTFFADLESSLDSDSSGGKNRQNRHGPASATACQASEPKAKANPKAGKPKAAVQGKEGAMSGKQPSVSSSARHKENTVPGSSCKTRPSDNPIAPQGKRPGVDAKATGAGGRPPAQNPTSLSYSIDFPTLGSTDFPILGAGLPPREKVAPPRQALDGSAPQTAQGGPGSGGWNPAERGGQFERHQAKASDTDRGQRYSRREEKLSFSDFLPKGMHDKRKKNKARGGQPQSAASSGSAASSLPAGSSYESAGAMKGPSSSSSFKHPAHPHGRKESGGSGGKKHRSGASLSSQQGRGKGSASDSEDESLSVFLTSAPSFIPPPRPHNREAETAATESHSVMCAAAEDEETVPKRPMGSGWGRRQGSDNPPHGAGGGVGRRDIRYRMDGNDRNRRDGDRGWRERGNDNDPRQQGWRDNRNPGEPRHGRGYHPHNRNPHEEGADNAREHRRPPPADDRDNDNAGARRGPPRHEPPPPGAGLGHQAPPPRQHYPPRPHQPAGLRPMEANLSFGRLRDLRTKEPAEVVTALAYSKEGLSRLLKNEDKLGSDPPLLRLLLSALAKTSLCSSMPAQRGEILNLVRTSSFLRLLGTHLTTASVTGQSVEVSALMGDSADLLRTLLNLFPSCFTDIVMVCAFIEMALLQLKQKGGELPMDVAEKMAELNVAKEAAMEEVRQKECKKSGVVDEDSQTPPDNFRDISVFPTMDDLNKVELPFLRKNKERGGYSSMDHYLDVQFRLLREDFVYPLREGIAEYLNAIATPQRGRKLKDIRVYHDVHILRAVCLQSGLGHRLTFDVSHGLKRVRWEVSKRLIYGSLVCLSADNFQTLFFATVANREPGDLQEGIVDVIFEHELQAVSAIPPETSFTMAETTAFFEAYRHVLSGLKKFEENQMPFQKYIVRCEKTVSEPKYLMDNEAVRTVRYDLRPLVDESVKLREDRNLVDQRRDVAYDFSSKSQPASEVPILDREDWPDSKLLNLDNSQFEALHRALTREFSVIQGPPGTGKTYVGLKIVKALLHNRTTWDPSSNSCMLIVCFTNHALDQFLEGVVSFFNGKVVRVGSRLRSEKLEAYSLSNMRWNMRRQREGVDRDFREITRLRFQGHDAMDGLKREIDTMGMKIESAKREVLHEDVLMSYMLDRHYDRLLDARLYLEEQGHYSHRGKTKKKVFCIPEWLGIGVVLQNSAHLTPEYLRQLEQELGGGEEEEVVEIEGEVQALEEHHRLDTDDVVPDGNDRQKKEKEKKRALARERSTYLAVDISRLDQDFGRDNSQQHQGGGGGGGGRGGFQIPRSQWKKLKRKLRRSVELDDRMTEMEERQVEDIWYLEMGERWRLYRRWTHNLCRSLKEEMTERERLYDELAKRQQETLMQEDKYILKTATVVAMTTTAAARYQSILQEIKPKIIVVEEAAEVLEGHVITTLSQDCQHLILIGDHKQLRPNPTVYALARKYNLELSLFERMINNGLKCVTLGLQHRMRPEIASLVRPIYPALENHPSVEEYEPIGGISSNLFFITHGAPEDHDEETKSHSNIYEARYLAALCLYLLKQGYHPSRITVLTTYSGQLFQLRKLMPKKGPFDGVRVTVVDNFQGEENDIILLSLVRSNEDNNIGFLKIENRVCVALSRAKMGLYVIGNFDLLTAESNLWQRITGDLRRSGRLGETLRLYCQNHPEDGGLTIRTPEDFERSPEGGCMKPCTARLDCGHVCMRMCHPYDKDHIEYKCTKRCERKMSCEFDHDCRKQCYMECGQCEVRVQRTMSKCGHRQWMECSQDSAEFICQEQCGVTLLCGHQCGDVCGERHRCFETVEHTWPCGHSGKVLCAERKSTPCTVPCSQQLFCGHTCAGTCCECHGGRLHKQCGNNCTKILVCGHACRDTCSNCPPCSHKCENSCVHSSCLKRCGLPCPPCNEPCAWQCPHHICKKLCHEPCNRPRCDEPCASLLQCRHPCIGLCGEPCPRLCRTCDADQVTEIFFGTEEEEDARFVELEDCHHVFEVGGLDQWMITTTDQHEDSVHLKACPRCKTPIRRNLRYGSLIKTQLKDIETIKTKMQGDDDKRQDTLTDIELMIEDETDVSYEGKKRDILENGDIASLAGLVAIANQMTFLEETKKLKMLMKKKTVLSFPFVDAVDNFQKWLCKAREVFSEQELSDAEAEMKRLRHFLALVTYKHLASMRSITLPDSVLDPLNNLIQRMANGQPHTERYLDMTSELLKQLEELVPESGLGVSNQERVMIVKAMGLGQGHWFKCPKGHVYAIADCGGATEESRCPECSATIGGTQHRLTEGNTLATEMDGATRPAWPTAMEDLDDGLHLNDLL